MFSFTVKVSYHHHKDIKLLNISFILINSAQQMKQYQDFNTKVSSNMKVENSNSVSFLQMLLVRLLECNFNHNSSEKLSGVNVLVHRTISISLTEILQFELDHFQQTTRNIGLIKQDPLHFMTTRSITTPRFSLMFVK